MATEPTLLDLLLNATPEQLDAVRSILDPKPYVLPEATQTAAEALSAILDDTTPDAPPTPERATQSVTIYGPNLSSAGQRLGDNHVHATGCADCRHYGHGRKFGGDDDGGWCIEVASKLDAAIALYPPSDFDWDPAIAADAADYVGSMYFAPCVNLPED